MAGLSLQTQHIWFELAHNTAVFFSLILPACSQHSGKALSSKSPFLLLPFQSSCAPRCIGEQSGSKEIQYHLTVSCKIHVLLLNDNVSLSCPSTACGILNVKHSYAVRSVTECHISSLLSEMQEGAAGTCTPK